MDAKAWLRGGQVLRYRFRLLRQVGLRLLLSALVVYVLVVAGLLWVHPLPWSLALLAAKAWCWQAMGQSTYPLLPQVTVGQWQQTQGLSGPGLEALAVIALRLKQAALFGLIPFGLSFVVGGLLLARSGRKHGADQRLTGMRLVTDPSLVADSVKRSPRGASEIRLLNQLPLPKGAETQGLLFHGSTGAGKSQGIMTLLDGIRARGEIAILYDKEGTLTPYYFDKTRDCLLNPLSSGCAPWDLWAECDDALTLHNAARLLVPKPATSHDPFWVDAARSLWVATAEKLRHTADASPQGLLQWLLLKPLSDLQTLLKGSEAENLVHPSIEKTAISVRSVLATYVSSLRFLNGLAADTPFGIRRWLQRQTQAQHPGWLFIASRAPYLEALKPLMSLWLGLALQSVQTLKGHRRVWLVIDELASLQRLDLLSDTLADIRKFGGCVVIGIQSVAQLQWLYGHAEAQAITDLLNTKIYYRSTSYPVAKWVSDDLGQGLWQAVNTSTAYGLDAIRDGNTLSRHREKRMTVEPSCLMTLEDLACYVRLIGEHPIVRLETTYHTRPNVAPNFAPRPLSLAIGKTTQPLTRPVAIDAHQPQATRSREGML